MLRIYCDKNENLAVEQLIRLLKKNNNDLSSQHIIITPSSYTLGIETKIFDSLGINGAFNFFIGSFERLASDSLENVSKEYLKKEASILVMHKAINNSVNKLKHYKKSCKTASLPRSMYNAIDRLRKSGYTIDDLKAKAVALTGSTKSKMNDIIVLFEEYNHIIERLNPDLISLFEMYKQYLTRDENIKNSYVYIMGFNTFSNIEIDLISKISKHAKETNLALSFIPGKLVNGVVTPMNTYTRFADQYQSKQIELEVMIEGKKVELPKDIEKKEKIKPTNSQFDFLRSEIFAFSSSTRQNDGSVVIYKEENIFEEINGVAQEIVSLVRKDGLRYKDIIILNSVPENKRNIKEIFKRYDIPIYVDEKLLLTDSIIYTFLKAAISMVKYPKDVTKLLALVKHPLFYDVSEYEDICHFENYILEHNIRYKEFKDHDFNKDALKKLGARVYKYQQAFENTKKDISTHIDSAKKIVSEEVILDRLNAILSGENEDVIDINNRAFNKLIKTLDEINKILKGEEEDLAVFDNILSSISRSQAISSLPKQLDCVIVDDLSMAKFDRKRVAFVISLTKSSALDIVKQDKILNAYDINKMIAVDLPIYPLDNEKLFNSRYEFVDQLSKIEKLYIGWSSIGLVNDSKDPSLVIDEISKLLNIDEKDYVSLYEKTSILNLNINDDKALETFIVNDENAYFQWLKAQSLSISSGDEQKYKTALDKISKYIDPQKLVDTCSSLQNSKQACPQFNMEDFAFKKDKNGDIETSASQLEKYFDCPFKHYMSYVLGANPRPEGLINALMFGNIMHEIVELFFKEVKDDFNKYSDSEFKDIAIKVIDVVMQRDEYKILSKIPQNKYLLDNLKKEAEEAIVELIKMIKQGEYLPQFIEQSFGYATDPDSLPTIDVATANKKIKIRGKIDRIDTADINGKEHIRLIDYKTGKRDISFEDIYKGKAIQLIIYAKALLGLPKSYTLGALGYLNVRDKYQKNETEPINYNALVLLDEDNINAIDGSFNIEKTLSTPGYHGIGIRWYKGELSAQEGLGLDQEFVEVNGIAEVDENAQIKNIISYVDELIKKAYEEIASGYIDKKTIKDREDREDCPYCDYRYICTNLGPGTISNPIDKVTDHDIKNFNIANAGGKNA